MNFSTRRYALLTLFITIVVFGYWGLYKHSLMILTKYNNLQTLKQKNIEYSERLEKVINIKNSKTPIDLALQTLNLQVPNTPQTEAFLEDFYILAAKEGYQLERADIVLSNATTNYVEINLRVAGDYKNLINLLTQVENLKRVTEVINARYYNNDVTLGVKIFYDKSNNK